MKSSFTRVGKGQAAPTPVPKLPPGTRPSVHNGQLLVSTGLHELDEILGGGVAVGTVLLVEQDVNTEYYASLLKYFLVEGISAGHGVSLISADEDPSEWIRKLPRNLTEAREEEKREEQLQVASSQSSESASRMTIAWQYEKYLNKETPQSGATSSINQSGTLKSSTVKAFCHSYDLNSYIKPERLASNHLVATLNANDLNDGKFLYRNMYKAILQAVESDYKSDIADKSKQRNILRIGIHSLASPFWTTTSENGDPELICFLHALRGLLRSSLGVCMITIPTHLYSTTFVNRIEHLCDTVVHFHSFIGAGAKVAESFNDFDGLFLVKKLPRLNSLVTHQPETMKYVFRQGRRKLHLEIPHMGPEESRTGNSSEPPKGSSLLCQPGPPGKQNPLDF